MVILEVELRGSRLIGGLHRGLVHGLGGVRVGRLRLAIVEAVLLAVVYILRHPKLSMRSSEVLRSRIRHALWLGNLIVWSGRVCARRSHVAIVLRRVYRRQILQIEVDVAEFEEIAQVVEVGIHLRHRIDLLAGPRPGLRIRPIHSLPRASTGSAPAQIVVEEVAEVEISASSAVAAKVEGSAAAVVETSRADRRMLRAWEGS